MKKMYALLIAIVMCFGFSMGQAENDSLAIDSLFETGASWLNNSFKSIEATILSTGYKKENSIAIWDAQLYTKNGGTPQDIVLFVDSSTKKITGLFMVFSANSSSFMQLYNLLTSTCGEAQIDSTSAYWETDTLGVSLSCSFLDMNNYSSATLFELQMGKYDFMLTMGLKDAFTSNSQDASTQGNMTPKPTVKPTPKPTANPLISKIKVHSLRIEKNSIGTPELYVVFQNNTPYSIDRIDFNIICYDAYGSKIKGYSYYDSSTCYYDDTIVESGGKTENYIYWTLSGLDGTKSVDIAIIKFHTTNGITISVPESLWEYTRYM